MTVRGWLGLLAAMTAALMAATPASAAPPVHGSVEWKTSDPKHAQRFGVSVMCFWRGSHVAVRLAFRSRTDRPASIDITPRYHVKDGDWHGDSGSSDQTVKLGPRASRAFIIDAGDPDGVDAGATLDECRPQIQAVNLGDVKLVVSNASVKAMLEDKLGARSDDGLRRVRSVACSGRHSCTIAVNVDQPTFDPEGELLDSQRPLWKRLFSDPQFRAATIVFWGKVQTVGGKELNDKVMQVYCDRRANAQINWDRVDAHGIKALCDYRAFVKFD